MRNEPGLQTKGGLMATRKDCSCKKTDGTAPANVCLAREVVYLLSWCFAMEKHVKMWVGNVENYQNDLMTINGSGKQTIHFPGKPAMR